MAKLVQHDGQILTSGAPGDWQPSVTITRLSGDRLPEGVIVRVLVDDTADRLFVLSVLKAIRKAIKRRDTLPL